MFIESVFFLRFNNNDNLHCFLEKKKKIHLFNMLNIFNFKWGAENVMEFLKKILNIAPLL